jgi:Family of unknown function (DUF6062)
LPATFRKMNGCNQTQTQLTCAIVNAGTRLKAKQKAEKQRAGQHGLWFTRDTFVKALAPGGCAICNAVRAFERKGIHSFLHEGMMFPSVRKKFLDGGGFCLLHFWMAKEIEDESWKSGGFGPAILCEDLARLGDVSVARAVEAEQKQASLLLKPREPRWFLPGHGCIFCEDNRGKERFLAEALEELIQEDAIRQAFAGNGLCIRHGQLALQIWKPSPSRDQLQCQLKAQLKELAADLQELVRKRDYQYRNESPGRERDCVLRALHFFVGPNPCRVRVSREPS